jgi:hypothetical protein
MDDTAMAQRDVKQQSQQPSDQNLRLRPRGHRNRQSVQFIARKVLGSFKAVGRPELAAPRLVWHFKYRTAYDYSAAASPWSLHVTDWLTPLCYGPWRTLASFAPCEPTQIICRFSIVISSIGSLKYILYKHFQESKGTIKIMKEVYRKKHNIYLEFNFIYKYQYILITQ